MYIVQSDPTRRTAGQYARAAVTRLRLRTLVWLGALAVATALLGRAFGLHDPRFLGSEVALLTSMFVISRYVMPLVERGDRGAAGEEQVGALLDELSDHGWQVIHDASLGRGNVDHILIGPGGVFTVETKSHQGPVRVGRVHGATLSQAQAQRRAIERVTGMEVEPMIVYSRAWVDRPLARRKGVRVVPARMLLGYLSKLTARLSDEQIEAARGLVAAALLEHSRREHDEHGAVALWSGMSISPFSARPSSADSERRRARLVVAIATLGIAATLLAYAISPGVRHAVGHAAHSVRHAVSHVFEHHHGHAQARPHVRLVAPLHAKRGQE
jgi:Nuclease-related domain